MIRESEQRRTGERMAQIALTRRIRASQVSTGELYDHELPEEAAPEADESADVEGGGAEARDPLDAGCQLTTVSALLEYTNRRAEADETASKAEEHLLRFSPRVTDGSRDDPAVQVADKFVAMANLWESAVQQDRTIQTVKNSVVEDCRPVEEGTDSDTARAHDSGRPPRPEAVYQHLSDVFRRLFTWEEIRNGTHHCRQRCEIRRYHEYSY